MPFVHEHRAESEYVTYPGESRLTEVFVGARYVRDECGCTVDSGIRMDNASVTLLGIICPEHVPHWTLALQTVEPKAGIEATCVQLNEWIEKIA